MVKEHFFRPLSMARDIFSLIQIYHGRMLVVILKYLNRFFFSKLNYLEQGREESKNIYMRTNK